ncbi:MAG: MarR family winged helix-turn-helix transcriptional regulator [Anaerovoracaceae bacterium]|nr:MarR family winged helix-turn-helix transcriptional regulator [Anaerovoracaceae bacterium]
MGELYKSKCYCTNLRRSANAVSALYDSELEGSGLTVGQYYLLINLRRLGSANITHWADTVGLERSTMVRNIRVVESHGFVEQTEGRGKTYTLSDKGNSALDKAIPKWEKAQSRIVELLGREDAEAVIRIGWTLQNLKAEDETVL